MNRPVKFYEKQFPFSEIDQFVKNYKTRKCKFYASDLAPNSTGEILEVEQAIHRASSALRNLNIPVEEHFYPVFRTSSARTFKDWKISRLAGVYFLLNSNPDNQRVAQLQHRLINLMKENF